jgi:Ca2+-dependent lipid-binding protein
LTDALALTVMDFNDHRKDTELGVANFDLASLQADAEQEDLKLPILKAGKTMGELRSSINFYPVLQPAKLADGTLDAVPETRSGICRITIHQAK